LGSCWRATTCVDLRAAAIELNVDSKVVVSTVYSELDGMMAYWRLIRKIRDFLKLDWEVSVGHTYQEANVCVHAMTNLGRDHMSALIVYEQCPVVISSLILADILGVTTPHMIVV
jgi:hypothetical protein